MADLLKTSINVRLRVGDKSNYFYLPVVALSMSFAVNELPVCSLELGVGINASSEELPQVITAEARERLSNSTPVQVLGLVQGDLIAGTPWPDTWKVWFEGRIDSVSEVVTRSQVGLNVTIRHWLADLQSSQLLSQYANPLDNRWGNHAAVFYGAQRSNPGAAVPGAVQQPQTIGYYADVSTLSSATIAEDIWAKGIKQFFAQILQGSSKFVSLDQSSCFDLLNIPRPEAALALQRIQGPSALLGTPYSDYAVPAAINTADRIVNPLILRAISRFIGSQPPSEYTSQDIWTRLTMGVCSPLGLSIVPLVDSAMVVPTCPTLRTPFCRYIVSNDILQIESFEPNRRPIRAVAIATHSEYRSLRTNTLGPGAAANLGQLSSGACFIGSDDNVYGTTLFKHPPPWLAGIGVYGTNGRRVSGLQSQAVMSGVSNPTLKADTQTAVSSSDLPSQVEVDTLYGDFAHYLYTLERLRDRDAKIATRLRFDIAPGSTIKVTAKPNQFVGQVFGSSSSSKGFGISPELQGFVSRVTIVVNATAKNAVTLFQLSHVRTLAENEKDDFSVTTPPLYAHPYYGAPLINDYAVPPCL